MALGAPEMCHNEALGWESGDLCLVLIFHTRSLHEPTLCLSPHL